MGNEEEGCGQRMQLKWEIATTMLHPGLSELQVMVLYQVMLVMMMTMMMVVMLVMVMIVMMVMVMLHDGAPGHVVACRFARAAGSSKKPPQS